MLLEIFFWISHNTFIFTKNQFGVTIAEYRASFFISTLYNFVWKHAMYDEFFFFKKKLFAFEFTFIIDIGNFLYLLKKRKMLMYHHCHDIYPVLTT